MIDEIRRVELFSFQVLILFFVLTFFDIQAFFLQEFHRPIGELGSIDSHF